MKRADLLCRLKKEIRRDEWKRLESGDGSLIISNYNRETLLFMKRMEEVEESEISEERIEGLHTALQKFLNLYMKDKPEGHKWIILSCIFLAFIQERPMHPSEFMNIETVEKEGRMTYFCPCKSEEEGNVCSFCVCRPLSEKQEGQQADG